MDSQAIARRRQTKRIPISLPVEVSDLDRDGLARKEPAVTIYIEQHRASLRTKIPRSVNSEIYLENPLKHLGGLCRVLSISAQRDGYFEMWVDLGNVENLWAIQFPSRNPTGSA